MTSFRILAMATLAALLATGCATRAPEADLFDLGPPTNASKVAQVPNLPAVSMPEVLTPTWLDGNNMFYRMLYANDQQPRPYAKTRWSMAPGLLLDQRVRSRITQAGGVVIQLSDGVVNLPTLRIETDDFTQNFSSVSSSDARVVLRASLYNGRALVAQKTFSSQAPAPTPDATGGARALAAASDAAIDEMITWLASVPIKK
jgi:cholesterol transport system auxiliary component